MNLSQKTHRQKLNIIITGSNTGIGYALAKQLYIKGHNIIFGARNQIKNQQAISSIKNEGLKYAQGQLGIISAYKLDLCKKQSLNQFYNNARKQLQKQDSSIGNKNARVDILINNAGLLGSDNLQLTEDGIQVSLSANYFGHFYLTYLLFPLLLQSKQGRIINISSDAYKKIRQINKQNYEQLQPGQYLLEEIWDLECKNKKYDPMQQYSISKLFSVLLTVSLQKKLNKKNIDRIKVVAIHPGFVNTTFGDHSQLVRNIKKQYSNYMISTQKSAQSIIKLCEKAYKQLKQGQYYNEDGQCQDMNKISLDQDINNRLWKVSKQKYSIQKFMILE